MKVTFRVREAETYMPFDANAQTETHQASCRSLYVHKQQSCSMAKPCWQRIHENPILHATMHLLWAQTAQFKRKLHGWVLSMFTDSADCGQFVGLRHKPWDKNNVIFPDGICPAAIKQRGSDSDRFTSLLGTQLIPKECIEGLS